MNKIYLSLTTRPERLISQHFNKVYNSLLNQIQPFDKLIINLSIKEFTYEIPDYLHTENVILNKTDICGPCTKLFGSIDIIPDNTVVIILDDDIVMKDNFIKSLYDSYLINTDKVSSHFTTTSFNNNYLEVAGLEDIYLILIILEILNIFIMKCHYVVDILMTIGYHGVLIN